jgi:hypothetical protein
MKFFEYGFLGIGMVGLICSIFFVINFNSVEYIPNALIYLLMMIAGSILSILMFFNERAENKRLYGDINAGSFKKRY